MSGVFHPQCDRDRKRRGRTPRSIPSASVIDAVYSPFVDGDADAWYWVRVQFPTADDARSSDKRWLQDLTERHGGEFPDTLLASVPGQVVLGFPDATSLQAFRDDLTTEGRYVVRASG